jgi:uncharacterized membrane protein
MTSLIQVVAAIVVAAVADYVWLGLVMKSFYIEGLRHTARLSSDGASIAPNLLSGLIVYALIALGLLLFVLPKAATAPQAFGWGALFGLVAYGIYDFTNHAIIAGYPLRIVFVDLAWGAVLCSAVAVIIFWLR